MRDMEKLSLPVDVQPMDDRHRAAATAAYAHFDKHKFGNEMLSMSGTLRDALQDAIEKEYTCVWLLFVLWLSRGRNMDLASWSSQCRRMALRRSRKAANVYESLVICERLETGCEDLLEAQHLMRLPSTGRFRARFEQCEAKFRKGCIGPSLTVQAERLAKAWHREETRFRHDYNDKLLSGLLFLSLAAILLFRFVVRVNIVETAAWIAFVFLQVSGLNACLACATMCLSRCQGPSSLALCCNCRYILSSTSAVAPCMTPAVGSSLSRSGS